MHNPFTEGNKGTGSPDMLMGSNSTALNTEEYQYRINRFEMGGQDTDDESSSLEALLNRSLTPDVVIIERKDSISATTGVYTCVIIYLERKPKGDNHAKAGY